MIVINVVEKRDAVLELAALDAQEGREFLVFVDAFGLVTPLYSCKAQVYIQNSPQHKVAAQR